MFSGPYGLLLELELMQAAQDLYGAWLGSWLSASLHLPRCAIGNTHSASFIIGYKPCEAAQH